MCSFEYVHFLKAYKNWAKPSTEPRKGKPRVSPHNRMNNKEEELMN
jgi:hypothetical protein